jgi:protein NrfC
MEKPGNPKEDNPQAITTMAQKELSRRKFLQIVGVFAVSTSALGLLACEGGNSGGGTGGCGTPAVVGPDGVPPEGTDCFGYIVVDRAKCQSCYSCMAACSLVNEGASGFSYSRIQVAADAFAKYPDDVRITQCRQCQDPKCVEKCPTGALHIDAENGNLRSIDLGKCIGCGMCVQACPFEPKRPMVRPHEQYGGQPKSRKCDLCLSAPYHFDPNGGGVGDDKVRACETVCPMKAIQFFPLVPVKDGVDYYNCNLRDQKWKNLGFDVNLQ